jgi:hypothetical protein
VVTGLPGAPPASGGHDAPGGPAGRVVAALDVPAAVASLGRGVPDAVAGSRVVVRDAGGAPLLTVTRPDARPTVVIAEGGPGDASAGPGQGSALTATREEVGHRWAIVLRRGGTPCGRLEPDDVLGRQWVLSGTGPPAAVHRRITREADRRRWAAVAYEVRLPAPDPAPAGGPVLDAARRWAVGAVLALDLLDTQLPDRDD